MLSMSHALLALTLRLNQHKQDYSIQVALRVKPKTKTNQRGIYARSGNFETQTNDVYDEASQQGAK